MDPPVSYSDKTEFANPYLRCTKCTRRVKYAVNLNAAGPIRMGPCLHQAAAVSTCMSWGPVDGCVCDEFGYVHQLPTGRQLNGWQRW